jgi:hypothetical protein
MLPHKLLMPTDDAFLVEVGNTTRRTPPQCSGSTAARRAQHPLIPEREALFAPLPPPPSVHHTVTETVDRSLHRMSDRR